jgi:hypothetical protein
MNDPTSPFFPEITRLRQVLERANESIDNKLEQIEEAGVDVIRRTDTVGSRLWETMGLDFRGRTIVGLTCCARCIVGNAEPNQD